MNLNNRVKRIEQTDLRTQVKRLIDNISRISNSEVNFLFELLAEERQKRGLVEKPEILAARGVFDMLIHKYKISEQEALTRALAAAKMGGYDLTEDEILEV